jgi:hypothetical protein
MRYGRLKWVHQEIIIDSYVMKYKHL